MVIKWSIKRKKKHSEIMKSIHPQWMKGRILPDSHKKNISISNKNKGMGNKRPCKPIRITNLLNGEIREFDCIGSAAEVVGTDKFYLAKLLKKTGKFKNWSFQYIK